MKLELKLTSCELLTNHYIIRGTLNNILHSKSGLVNEIYLSIYLSQISVCIGIMVRVFANGPGDLGSIPGGVIPKTKKWYLMLTLSILG